MIYFDLIYLFHFLLYNSYAAVALMNSQSVLLPKSL